MSHAETTKPDDSQGAVRLEEDPVLVSSRREAIVVFCSFIISMFWSILTCYFLGYDRKVDDLTYIIGFPDWVFWGIVIPWGACIVFSFYFGAFMVRDEDLGEELEEQDEFI